MNVRMVLQLPERTISGPWETVGDGPNALWHARQAAARAFWSGDTRSRLWTAYGAFETSDRLPDPSTPTPGKVRAGQPSTARAAAQLVAPAAASDRSRILGILYRAGGLTADGVTEELVRQGRTIVANHTATRLDELRAGGWTVRTTGTRPTRRGHPARVWELSPAGRAEWAQHERAAR